MAYAPGSFSWGSSDAYEAYMGRWSRPLARAFLPWFGAPEHAAWLDAGCGTGALTAAILDLAAPASVLGIDPSADFIKAAGDQIDDPRATFDVGDARALAIEPDRFDAVVAGLVLNHIADPPAAAAEMLRVAQPAGMVGAYVWDYSGEMQLMRYFWEAVASTDANAAVVDPRSHYQICQPEPLSSLFRDVGLVDVVVEAVDIPLRFRDIDDYWVPHTLPGPAAAQRYVATLDDDRKAALRNELQTSLPVADDGSIPLIGRAWAVRGTKFAG